MLGNVPDFAILTLALSKLGATVVPLDPTTGSPGCTSRSSRTSSARTGT